MQKKLKLMIGQSYVSKCKERLLFHAYVEVIFNKIQHTRTYLIFSLQIVEGAILKVAS